MSFKNEIADWDDLRLFLAVAEAGGLVGAATRTGVSSPTLSRRMRHLEDTLTLKLFERTQIGYDLTRHGQELLTRVRAMDEHSRAIQMWRRQLDQRPTVRITAGFWTSIFLARHFQDLCTGADTPRLEIVTGANFLNLGQREADIAIRNKTPQQPGLVRKRIGQVSFAIYGSTAYCATHPLAATEERYHSCNWILPTTKGNTGASSLWLRRKIEGAVMLRCDSPQAVLEAVKSGAGLCILPKFIGSLTPELQQCSPPIASITHTQWLVRHQEDGHMPHIRSVLRSLDSLFQTHKASFE